MRNTCPHCQKDFDVPATVSLVDPKELHLERPQLRDMRHRIALVGIHGLDRVQIAASPEKFNDAFMGPQPEIGPRDKQRLLLDQYVRGQIDLSAFEQRVGQLLRESES